MSFNTGTGQTHKDTSQTSLVLTGGRPCKPGVLLSHQSPDLWVKGGAIVEKGMCVLGNVSSAGIFQGTFVGNIITNNITAEDINEPIVISGDVSVPEGNVSVENIVVNRDAYFFGNIYGTSFSGNVGNVPGNLTVGGTLYTNNFDVSGSTTFHGPVHIDGGPLLVDGDTTMNGNLTVLNLHVLNQALFSGPVTMQSDLLVQGDTTLQDLNVMNDAAVGGNLAIGGDLTVDGQFTINGELVVDSLSVINDGVIGGNLTVGGDLIVDGVLTGLGAPVLDTLASPTYPTNLTKGVWYGLNTKANAFDSTCVTLGQNADTGALNTIAIGSGASATSASSTAIGRNVVANQVGGFFIAHRGPLAIVANPAGFISGTNELIEVTSSRRFKENIRDLEEVSDRIDMLRSVRYEAKPGCGDDREHIGFIAEEVQDIFPEFVTFNGAGETTGLMFDRMTSVLLKEIQALRRRLAKVEAQLS